MKNKIKYDATLDVSSIEVLNKEFSIAKVYIMYHGDNRNNSSMSKEVVEEALPSLFNTPVVAEFIEKNNDFGTHGGKIEIKDGEAEYILTTKPYGVVPESSNPRWEMVEDEDGNEKEYLVADIILWSDRYTELEKTIEEFSNQSMEISVYDGGINKKGIYQIDKFEFSALCLLGQDVEPAFEQAKVVSYSLDEFKKDMNLFMKNYKEYCTQCDFNKRTEERGVDEIKFDELKKKVEEFSLTMKQKWQKVSDSLENENYYDGEDLIGAGYYWVRDFDEEFVYVEKYSWFMDGSDKEENLRVKYTFEDDECIINKESFEEIVYEPITLVEKKQLEKERSTVEMALDSEIAYRKETEDKIKDFDELTSKAEEFESTIQEKDAKIVELEEFKLEVETNIHKAEVEETLNSFKDVLDGNEEFDELREKAFEMEVDEVENACYQLIGKLNYIKNSKDKKTVPNKQFSFTSKTKVITEDEELKKYTKKYGVDMAKYFIKK